MGTILSYIKSKDNETLECFVTIMTNIIGHFIPSIFSAAQLADQFLDDDKKTTIIRFISRRALIRKTARHAAYAEYRQQTQLCQCGICTARGVSRNENIQENLDGLYDFLIRFDESEEYVTEIKRFMDITKICYYAFEYDLEICEQLPNNKQMLGNHRTTYFFKPIKDLIERGVREKSGSNLPKYQPGKPVPILVDFMGSDTSEPSTSAGRRVGRPAESARTRVSVQKILPRQLQDKTSVSSHASEVRTHTDRGSQHDSVPSYHPEDDPRFIKLMQSCSQPLDVTDEAYAAQYMQSVEDVKSGSEGDRPSRAPVTKMRVIEQDAQFPTIKLTQLQKEAQESKSKTKPKMSSEEALSEKSKKPEGHPKRAAKKGQRLESRRLEELNLEEQIRQQVIAGIKAFHEKQKQEEAEQAKAAVGKSFEVPPQEDDEEDEQEQEKPDDGEQKSGSVLDEVLKTSQEELQKKRRDFEIMQEKMNAYQRELETAQEKERILRGLKDAQMVDKQPKVRSVPKQATTATQIKAEEKQFEDAQNADKQPKVDSVTVSTQTEIVEKESKAQSIQTKITHLTKIGTSSQQLITASKSVQVGTQQAITVSESVQVGTPIVHLREAATSTRKPREFTFGGRGQVNIKDELPLKLRQPTEESVQTPSDPTSIQFSEPLVEEPSIFQEPVEVESEPEAEPQSVEVSPLMIPSSDEIPSDIINRIVEAIETRRQTEPESPKEETSAELDLTRQELINLIRQTVREMLKKEVLRDQLREERPAATQTDESDKGAHRQIVLGTRGFKVRLDISKIVDEVYMIVLGMIEEQSRQERKPLDTFTQECHISPATSARRSEGPSAPEPEVLPRSPTPGRHLLQHQKGEGDYQTSLLSKQAKDATKWRTTCGSGGEGSRPGYKGMLSSSGTMLSKPTSSETEPKKSEKKHTSTERVTHKKRRSGRDASERQPVPFRLHVPMYFSPIDSALSESDSSDGSDEAKKKDKNKPGLRGGASTWLRVHSKDILQEEGHVSDGEMQSFTAADADADVSQNQQEKSKEAKE